MSAINLDKLAQRTAEQALDIVYEGKPLREWIRILKELMTRYNGKEAVEKAAFELPEWRKLPWN